MTTTSDLIGLGFPAALAASEGVQIATLAGVGTAQSGAGAIGANFTQVTTSAGQTAVVLPANMPLGSPYYVYNNSATAALLFPPTGCTIDNGSANASVSIAQNRGRAVWRVSATAFITFYGA